MTDTPDTKVATPSLHADSPGRPSLDARDSNFNRIRLNPTTKEDILAHIDDSSETLDYYPDETDSTTSHDDKLTAPESIVAPPLLSKTKSPKNKRHSFFGRKEAGSGLKKEVDPSDIATPKAEVQDPLAKKGASLAPESAATPEGSTGHLTPTGGLSQVPTQEDTEGREGAKRPGTMRRLTTKIRRTISSKPEGEGEQHQ